MEDSDKKFRELTNYRLRNTSLLHQFNILQDEDGNYLLNIWKSYSIPDDIKNNEDYTFEHDVDNNDWWDSIAYDYYENENLWWVVALTNDVVNPFEELTPGETIDILDDRFLYQVIKEIKNISEL